MRRLLLLLASCTAQDPLALPEVAGARSMLLVYSDVEHEKEGIFGVDLENASLAPISLEERDRFFVLAYPMTLAELGLSPGKIEIVTDAPDRPLPSGYAVYEATAPDREVVEIEDEAFREFMGDVQLRGFASPECEDMGGCFQLIAGDEFCKLPCTLPEVEAPRLPDPPNAPMFDPCPAGWIAELGACTPPSIVGCGPGQAQFLGDAGCSSVAGPCASRFPSGLSGAEYVDANVAGPGSGTMNDPYNRISSATAATIALAEGTYTEALVIDRNVEIVGACGRAVIAGSLRIEATAILRNVGVTGAIDARGDLTVRDAELDQLSVVGSVTAERVLLREGSRGIVSGGTLVLTGARIMGGLGSAVFISGGSATLTDVLVTDRTGRGIEITGGTAIVERALLSNTTRSAVAISGGSADLTDVAIRDTPDVWLSKHGFEVSGSGSLVARDVLVTDTGEVGVYVAGGRAEITDAVFSEIGRPGLLVRGTGSLSAAQVKIDRPHAFGARASGGTLSLADVAIDSVVRSRITIDGELENWDGYGVYAEQPESISLTRVGVSGASGIGVGIYGAQNADLSSVQVQSVERRDSASARGITMYDTAGTLSQIRIEDVRGIGLDLYAVMQKQLRTDDLSIANVDTIGFTPSVVTITGSRIAIEGATQAAIRFDRAAITWSDARFSGTGSGALIGTEDNMDYRESFFRLDGARFEDQDGACLALGWYGVIQAQDTVVTGCGIGFQVLVVEEGREKVPEGILFYRNERNVKVPGE